MYPGARWAVAVLAVAAGSARGQSQQDAGLGPSEDAGVVLAPADAGVPSPVEAPVAVTARAGEGLQVSTPVGTFTLWGSAELFYQWNFNNPSNGLTQFRAFDTRHNTFGIQNVVLGTRWDARHAYARLTLQAGLTPFTYYLAEPALGGSAGAGATGPAFWHFLQEAVVGWVFDDARRFKVAAGLFLSPIGPEAMNLKDDWFWSRSNLFYGLPFYHLGVAASLALTERWTVSAGVVNGWLNVVDNNPEKSITLKAAWASPREDFHLHVLYFGGVERPAGAPEGRGWRHLLDFVSTWQVNERVAMRFELNGGLEPTAFGLAGWAAAQLGIRLQLVPWLFLAGRGDVFFEETPAGAAPIFFPSPEVTSGTLTLEVRPLETVALRLEYRHDQAGAPMYFGGAVPADGRATFALQDTLTLGVVAWF